VFCGHVHEPALYFHGADARPQAFNPMPGVPIPVPSHRHWLVIAGSCGQARDGEPRTNYALFDAARKQLTFHRLAYDHLTTARKIRAAGLPEKLAQRIEQGH
jgi:diadenosine tetraphosphatase ApaH/serine/threonine PP2A family protein phosphatase